MAVDHRFGSPSTELKLDVVGSYLKAFTTALRNYWPELWYIDAFAGTGSRTVSFPAREQDLLQEPEEARIERLRGSAQIALDVRPLFQRLIFIEKRPTFCAELDRIAAAHPDRDVRVWPGEANAEIAEHCARRGWAGVRAVMFLDPYGMEVEWSTLGAIRSTEAIDLWYLFSLEGLYRQAARRFDAIDSRKEAAITRMLGTDEWKQVLYSPRTQTSLFDEGPVLDRTAGVPELAAYVKKRLRSLFPTVLDPLRLPGKGAPRFLLFFVGSNPAPKAIRLSTKIAGHILKAGISSQVRSR